MKQNDKNLKKLKNDKMTKIRLSKQVQGQIFFNVEFDECEKYIHPWNVDATQLGCQESQTQLQDVDAAYLGHQK